MEPNPERRCMVCGAPAVVALCSNCVAFYEIDNGPDPAPVGVRELRLYAERRDPMSTQTVAEFIQQPAERIRQLILEQIRPFVEVQLRRALEAEWHRWLITWVRYNVRAFSNENLAELAGVVNEEVGRRARTVSGSTTLS